MTYRPKTGFEFILTNASEIVDFATTFGVSAYRQSEEGGIIINLARGNFWKVPVRNGKMDYQNKVPNDLGRDAHTMLLDYHLKSGDMISQPSNPFLCPECQEKGLITEIQRKLRGKCPSTNLPRVRHQCTAEYPNGPTGKWTKLVVGADGESVREEQERLFRVNSSTSLSYEEKSNATRQMVQVFADMSKDPQGRALVNQLWSKIYISPDIDPAMKPEIEAVVNLLRNNVAKGTFENLIRKTKSEKAQETMAAREQETEREVD